jgi:hypothetical protein
VDEREWLNSTTPHTMLAFLRDSGRTSERKLRLFSVACCRHIWHLLSDPLLPRAVEVAERHAAGRDSRKELRAAAHALRHMHDASLRESSTDCALHAVSYACRSVDSLYQVGTMAAWAVFYARADSRNGSADAERAEESFQCVVLRDIFGSLPFRPSLSLAPSVLAWGDGCIVKLATNIYEERSLPEGTLDGGHLAILADALEEAGCHDEEILSHLRQQGASHYRGCWVIDLLLKKA